MSYTSRVVEYMDFDGLSESDAIARVAAERMAFVPSCLKCDQPCHEGTGYCAPHLTEARRDWYDSEDRAAKLARDVDAYRQADGFSEEEAA